MIFLLDPIITSDPAVSGTHLAVCKQSMSPEHLSSSNNSLTEILRSFWETEAVGIKESSNLESSSEIFLSSVKFHEGRYEVGLPWLREKDEVSQHYNLCFNRLQHLQGRLIKDPNLLRDYQSLISEQHKLGITELANDVEKPDKLCIHFLLHQPIIKHD